LLKYKINRNKDSVSNEGLRSPNKKLNTRNVNSQIWYIEMQVTAVCNIYLHLFFCFNQGVG